MWLLLCRVWLTHPGAPGQIPTDLSELKIWIDESYGSVNVLICTQAVRKPDTHAICNGGVSMWLQPHSCNSCKSCTTAVPLGDDSARRSGPANVSGRIAKVPDTTGPPQPPPYAAPRLLCVCQLPLPPKVGRRVAFLQRLRIQPPSFLGAASVSTCVGSSRDIPCPVFYIASSACLCLGSPGTIEDNTDGLIIHGTYLILAKLTCSSLVSSAR
ncbi:hypothetical protein QBC34DRAFT_78998 [Podospora aff. communis PSN243]|uniref:Uncharacterized protein n=1 Tax=Podospora aff. communis PSN243 TaxID=3040156 RepID=A0AAV9GQA5_9PEZI|nr:hypothetical protein QBC34DRAFT_78998 [Podospora aff. communis PSN243]